MAIDVLIPPNFPDGQSAVNATPMAKPSMKLWRASPKRIIQATVLNDLIGIALFDIIISWFLSVMGTMELVVLNLDFL